MPIQQKSDIVNQFLLRAAEAADGNDEERLLRTMMEGNLGDEESDDNEEEEFNNEDWNDDTHYDGKIASVERKLCLFQTKTIQKIILRLWTLLIRAAHNSDSTTSTAQDKALHEGIMPDRTGREKTDSREISLNVVGRQHLRKSLEENVHLSMQQAQSRQKEGMEDPMMSSQMGRRKEDMTTNAVANGQMTVQSQIANADSIQCMRVSSRDPTSTIATIGPNSRSTVAMLGNALSKQAKTADKAANISISTSISTSRVSALKTRVSATGKPLNMNPDYDPDRELIDPIVVKSLKDDDMIPVKRDSKGNEIKLTEEEKQNFRASRSLGTHNLHVNDPEYRKRTIGMATFVEFDMILQRLLMQDIDYSVVKCRNSAIADWIEAVNHVPRARMTLEQFALFIFDLSVIWCSLSYASFLFFLGALFIGSTSSNGVQTNGFKSIYDTERLPPLFFQMLHEIGTDSGCGHNVTGSKDPGGAFHSASSFQSQNINTSLFQSSLNNSESAINHKVGFDVRNNSSSLFEVNNNSSIGSSGGVLNNSNSNGGGALDAFNCSSSGGHYTTRVVSNKTSLNKEEKLKADLAADDSRDINRQQSHLLDRETKKKVMNSSGLVEPSDLLSEGASVSDSRRSSTPDNNSERKSMKQKEEFKEKNLSFQLWYRRNFESESQTLLYVQRQLFQITRDVRSVFLFASKLVSNRERVLTLLDASKRLALDLDKIQPVDGRVLVKSAPGWKKNNKEELAKLTGSPVKSPTGGSSPALCPVLYGSTLYSVMQKYKSPQGQQPPSSRIDTSRLDNNVKLLPTTPAQTVGVNGKPMRNYVQKTRVPDSSLTVGLSADWESRMVDFGGNPGPGVNIQYGTGFTQKSNPGQNQSTKQKFNPPLSVLAKAGQLNVGANGNVSTGGNIDPTGGMVSATGGGSLTGGNTTSNTAGSLTKPSYNNTHRSNQTSFFNESLQQSSIGMYSPPQQMQGSMSFHTGGSTTSHNNNMTPQSILDPIRDPQNPNNILVNTKNPESKKELLFIQRFLDFIEQENRIADNHEEHLPNYDLPIRLPEIYENQLKPWLSTRASDIRYYVASQEATVMEKTGKFMSITNLPGPFQSRCEEPVWREMRARLRKILARGQKKQERKKKRKTARKNRFGRTRAEAKRALGEMPGRELMLYLNQKQADFNLEEQLLQQQILDSGSVGDTISPEKNVRELQRMKIIKSEFVERVLDKDAILSQQMPNTFWKRY